MMMKTVWLLSSSWAISSVSVVPTVTCVGPTLRLWVCWKHLISCIPRETNDSICLLLEATSCTHGISTWIRRTLALSYIRLCSATFLSWLSPSGVCWIWCVAGRNTWSSLPPLASVFLSNVTHRVTLGLKNSST
uniref:Secreted protein n=1 Tax=Brassica oleracea TaxID=3712 RepID=A0A3P6EGF5_BRAOL|nr:unnamed protein product [Brassica oleracea]